MNCGFPCEIELEYVVQSPGTRSSDSELPFPFPLLSSSMKQAQRGEQTERSLLLCPTAGKSGAHASGRRGARGVRAWVPQGLLPGRERPGRPAGADRPSALELGVPSTGAREAASGRCRWHGPGLAFPAARARLMEVTSWPSVPCCLIVLPNATV